MTTSPKETILITGGAGFIGSHLCETLINNGYRVICIDNLITGNIDNISHLIPEDNFRFIEQDITKYIDIREDIGWILHFASPASPVDYLKFPIQTLKVGSLGTHNVLGLAKTKGAGCLLASTSEVYGDPLQHPQTEGYWGNVNPIGLRGVYDEAKRFAEAIATAYHRVHKLEVRIARIFNTYGPRMRRRDGRAVPAFINQALENKPITVFGDGSQTRSFCHISDLVKGIIKLMNSSVSEPVNLGNPEEISILEIAKCIRSLTGSHSPIVHRELPSDDPKVRRPDITRAREMLGWSQEIDLKEGLEETIKWFRSK